MMAVRIVFGQAFETVKEATEYNLAKREEPIERRRAKRSYRATSTDGTEEEIHGFYQRTPRTPSTTTRPESPASHRRSSRSMTPPKRPPSPLQRELSVAKTKLRRVSPAKVVRRAVSLVAAVPDAVLFHVSGRIPPDTSAFKPPGMLSASVAASAAPVPPKRPIGRRKSAPAKVTSAPHNLKASADEVMLASMHEVDAGPPSKRKRKLNFSLNRHAAALANITGLTHRHLQKLWTLFMEIDLDNSGEIDYSELCMFFEVARSAFVDAIFELADVNESGELDFDEFVGVVCMYACMSRDDILRLCFGAFDLDNSGFIDEDEFMTLTEAISSGDPTFPGSFKKALQQFDKNGDGRLSFSEFREIHRIFPLLLFPAFNFQNLIWNHTFGMNEWVRLKVEIERREVVEEYKRTHDGVAPRMTLREIIMLPLRSYYAPYVQSASAAATASAGGLEDLAEALKDVAVDTKPGVKKAPPAGGWMGDTTRKKR
jgi:Ca2+-binding EF-hand superfamily protein